MTCRQHAEQRYRGDPQLCDVEMLCKNRASILGQFTNQEEKKSANSAEPCGRTISRPLLFI